jgi:hypothetical protein
MIEKLKRRHKGNWSGLIFEHITLLNPSMLWYLGLVSSSQYKNSGSSPKMNPYTFPSLSTFANYDVSNE